MKKITLLFILTIFGLLELQNLNAQITVASDNADNYSSWSNGNNAGFGFGAWDMWITGTGGWYLGNSVTPGFGDINTNSKAFGIWGNPSGANQSNAQRTFASDVWADGASFSIQIAVAFRNGYKGIDLFAPGWEKIWTFNVGSDKYTAGGADQSWEYSQSSIFNLTVTQNGSNLDISLVRGSDSYTTTINSKTLHGFKLYIGSTESGNDLNNLFFNNLKVSYSDWSKVPSTIRVDVDQNSTLDVNKTISDLRINASTTLNVSAGKQLTVGTALTNNGTLTLKSTDVGGTASIITSGTVSGAGTTEVEQYISSTATGTTGRNWYISSPLSAATSSTITTETGNGLVYWNGSAWTDAGTTMDVMKGYIAKSPNGNKTIKFTGGNLNTGDKSVENLALGFNLIGNPYASWVKFSEASKTNIATTIWFRSKSTGSYVFQTFNTSGSVSVNGGTDIIPPMQAFWIKTTNATNSFGFLNTNRTHQTDNKLKIPAINSNELLRLQIGGAGLENDETVVYFNQNAQDTFDNYDSEKMFNNSSAIPEIYTTANDNKLVINGLHNSYAGLELALGFNTNVNTNYNFQIKATEIQNLENYKIVLVDKVAGEEIVLSDGLSYQFVSNSTSGSDRFTILFKTAEGTTGEFIDNNSTGITVYSNNKNIKLNCNKTLYENASVSLYNSVGQVIHNQSISSSSTILNKEFENGLYLLKIENGGKTEVLRTIVK